jgi:hypothetical protein
MPLVIGSGPSVTDYQREDVIRLANYAFTFCVNSVAFEYPADIIVALDPDFILSNFNNLQEIGKPIVCRQYPSIEVLELDKIYIPMDTIRKYPYSGMVAAKLSDEIANQTQGRPSYLLGIDGGAGNYKGYKGGGDYTKGDYNELGLSKTVSLAVHSRVSCWPKLSKLPHPRKVVVTPEYRGLVTAWIRANAAKVL